MSGDDHVAIARRGVELFNADELDDLAGISQPDIVWRPAIGTLEDREYHGMDGVREYRRDLSAAFEDVHFETESLRAVGPDTVLVVGRLQGTGSSSGAAVSGQRGLVMRLRDGKIAWMASFPTVAEAERVAAEGGS